MAFSLNMLNFSLFIFQTEQITDIYFPHQRVLTPSLSIYFSTSKILRKQCTMFIVAIAVGFVILFCSCCQPEAGYKGRQKTSAARYAVQAM